MKSFLLFVSLVGGAYALTCSQIPSSQIYNGSDFYFPGSDSKPTALPANFDCTYTIQAPVSPSQVLYATVGLSNQLKGQNDFIIVTDSFGGRKTLNSQSQSYFEYEVFPGQPLTIHVITKSVLTNSQFSLHVKYGQANVGPSQVLASGGEMNYLALATIGQDAKRLSSLTFRSGEQMSVLLAVDRHDYPLDYLNRVYVIDGDFFQQAKVAPLLSLVYYDAFNSTTNKLTLVSFQTATYPDTAVIINPISEVNKLAQLTAQPSPTGHENKIQLKALSSGVNAVEVLAVQGNQIIFHPVTFSGTPSSNCIAQVLSGPPNNSSQVLFDLYQNKAQLPKTFNAKYVSVIAQNCGFTIAVITPFSNSL